ncbi:MAG: cell division protein ZipA C-terminal FtsZ-binding domain-containing protein [Thiohalocapsa sp.]|jgi:cell division protein ZipA|uniref:cell division protein ZipA C-terminal FtsZ-binding domain-containing protein n=1 Tax=Thiohalocapsa sp. TaxID=2497641 RepID=UPI0025DB25DC|nr:cell division protein ZipA C-terminal FtsZ-binding domain-containing protein [Thiohalocapsa sp.]MCG6940183.1 cell division protein ZipA C-terminal FtsZ-binding domain-containing protein [Thiohalocapsa sp.]
MDATTLRLILTVIGAVFLIGLYLWEKQRAQGFTGARRVRRPPSRRRQEPNFGRLGEADDDDSAASAYAYGDDADDLSYEAVPAPESAMTDAYDDDEGEQSASERAAAGAAGAASDELLIQLYITSPGGAFDGEDILAAAERCKLRPGDMDIFHRTRGDAPHGEPLFSMANLVNPGTFPFDDMSEFASPGLAVFAQFRGEPSDLMVFDEMLDGARIMAELLGGDIRGPQRQPLRDADAKALRTQVRALLHGNAATADTP